MSQTQFQFADPPQGMGYCGHLASTCHAAKRLGCEPSKLLLLSSGTIIENGKESVKKYLKSINLERFRLVFLYSGLTSSNFIVDQYYGTEHLHESIDRSVVDQWVNAPIIGKFGFPDQNQYICTNFKLVSAQKQVI